MPCVTYAQTSWTYFVLVPDLYYFHVLQSSGAKITVRQSVELDIRNPSSLPVTVSVSWTGAPTVEIAESGISNVTLQRRTRIFAYIS